MEDKMFTENDEQSLRKMYESHSRRLKSPFNEDEFMDIVKTAFNNSSNARRFYDESNSFWGYIDREIHYLEKEDSCFFGQDRYNQMFTSLNRFIMGFIVLANQHPREELEAPYTLLFSLNMKEFSKKLRDVADLNLFINH